MNISWDAAGYEKGFLLVPAYGRGVIDLIDARPGATCLDLGCGNGALTVELRRRGLDAFGTDASAEMIELARARHPDLRFVRADATNFTLDEPIDVVFSNAMLHWIDREKHPDALACVSAALAPRGQLVFERGGRDCCARIHGALARVLIVARGRGYEILFWFPTVGEHAPLVEAAGLRVTHAELFDRPTKLPGPEGRADWIHLFVKRPFADVPADEADAIVTEAMNDLRGECCQDGVWHADYARLRMRAVQV
jgi:SAM-dependent methyltransferase